MRVRRVHLRPHHVPSGGFTLLELVLVMVLLTILLGAVAPSLRGFLTASRSRDAAAQLVAVMHWARARAAADSRVYRLNIDAAAGAYRLTVQEGDEFVPVPNDFGQPFTLPPNSQIALTPIGGEAMATDSNGVIDFHPDGRSGTAVLHLTDAHGDVIVVACKAPSEPYRVLSAEEVTRL